MHNAINKFFEIEFDENFYENIFKNLKEIINFHAGEIYYINPKRLEFSYGKKSDLPYLTEDLRYKKTKFGEIVIYSKNFTDEDKNNFQSFACLISNQIKDFEISKIMKMQVEALQTGYLKVKKAEEFKNKFISHVSHELRTPLNSILGYSDLLNSAGKLNEKQKDFVNEIKVSGLNLLTMINELLDISKIEADAVKLTKTEFEIETLFNETENIIKPLLMNKNIKFIKKTEKFSLTADYQKLQQVLLNLLSNAIKFTPEKGEITLNAIKSENQVTISVKDTGVGIEEKNFDKIFEKFEQIIGTQNSTGLGLTIAKEFIKLHNGEITVKSKPNKGAEFIIYMPA